MTTRLLANKGTIPYEDYRLAYEAHGPTDGPLMILIHGILLDAACNRDLALAFASKGYRVVLLDLLGHGKSDKPRHAKELRVEFFAEQVGVTLDYFGVESAVIGGMSLGAITSLQFAVQAPHRVKAMILEMPVMERAVPAAAMMLVPLLGAVRYAAPVYRLFARGMRMMPRPKNGLFESGMNALSQEPESIASVLHGVLVGSVVPPKRERVKLTMPTLVIGHGRDWLHDLEDAKILANELPNAEFMMANSIFELRTRPERMLPEIMRFLRAVEREQKAA